MNETTGPRVELRRTWSAKRDPAYQWVFGCRNMGNHKQLTRSSETYHNRLDAYEAARQAHPGIPIWQSSTSYGAEVWEQVWPESDRPTDG